MFVHRLRDRFPGCAVTECHPKALLKACHAEQWVSFAKKYRIADYPANEDGRDAIIAAVCAREGFNRNWSGDLSLHRLSSEMDPAQHWLGPIHYWWPEAQDFNIIKDKHR
jgi:hypothetical protein